MVNAWIEHVRKYAKDNNISYGCAVTEAKASYVKQPKAPRKARTPKQPKIKVSEPPETLEQRIKNRVKENRMLGSKPDTANIKSIKERLKLRMEKNRASK